LISDKKIGINEKDKEGQTPLLFAIDCSFSLEIVQFLVEEGSNLDVQDSEGMTPLHVSHVLESNDVFEFLLSKGADHKIKSNDGEVVDEKVVQKFLDGLHLS